MKGIKSSPNNSLIIDETCPIYDFINDLHKKRKIIIDQTDNELTSEHDIIFRVREMPRNVVGAT